MRHYKAKNERNKITKGYRREIYTKRKEYGNK
jgi:hypothetical protein